jgi:predicted ABC-type transport system involved in lysophospholipase L1 biosynthesis ATPase subunit
VTEPIVAALDVHKRYGKKGVLMDASFRAHGGEIVAILGENGGGKSTLLRILAGVVRADRGRVALAGKAGFCPQECVLYPYLTPDEHLDLFGCAEGLAPRRVRERADVLFETFGFRHHRKRLVHELSGGTRQKLNLALALLADPPLLLPDAARHHRSIQRRRPPRHRRGVARVRRGGAPARRRRVRRAHPTREARMTPTVARPRLRYAKIVVAAYALWFACFWVVGTR